MRKWATLLACAVVLAGCDEDPPNLYKQIMPARDARDTDRLIEILRSDTSQEAVRDIESDPFISTRLGPRAADALAYVVRNDPPLRSKVENILRSDRDAATSPEARIIIENAIMKLNVVDIGKTKRHLYDRSMQLVSSDPDAKAPPLTPVEKLSVGRIEPNTKVDAIVVAKRDYGEDRPSIVDFAPSLTGLTVSEIEAVRDGSSRVAFVFQYDDFEGRYSGSCKGNAYRVNSIVYLLNLATGEIEGGVEIAGGDPPSWSSAPEGQACHGRGQPPDHSGYVQAQAQ